MSGQSIRARAECNGLSRHTVYRRRKQGMTLEQALKCPSMRQPVQDHLGTWFPSVLAMARHWGIRYQALYHRYRISGWSLERALTVPVRSAQDHTVQDHTGAKFPSVAEMVAHWGIKYATFRQRIRLHWSLEKALTIPAPSGVQDHEGTWFPSVRAMVSRWGVNYKTYCSRRWRDGWSLEKALTTPAKKERA